MSVSKIPKWLWGKRIGVFDLETDFIPTTIIFMNGLSFIDIDLKGNPHITPSKTYTYKWTPYANGSLMESIVLIRQCDIICGHNLIGFDLMEIKKHLGVTLTIPVLDTIILAKIMMSKDDLYAIDAELNLLDIIDRSRPFALDAFGKRLGDSKLVFKKFDKMTKEMQIYCDQDVNLTSTLLLHLLKQENFPFKDVIILEHHTASIIAKQTEFGFYMDLKKTETLNTKLLKEKGELSRQLLDIFSPKFLKDGKEKMYKAISKTRKYLPNSKWRKPW